MDKPLGKIIGYDICNNHCYIEVDKSKIIILDNGDIIFLIAQSTTGSVIVNAISLYKDCDNRYVFIIDITNNNNLKDYIGANISFRPIQSAPMCLGNIIPISSILNLIVHE